MKRTLLAVGVAILAAIVAVGAFAPVWRTRALGWVRQEKFHRGMPAHYWLEKLSSPSGNERYEAILALSGDADAIPALTALLQDEFPMLRQHAAVALGGFEKDATVAVPALTAMLQDPDRSCRQAAAAALKQIDPAAAARAGVP